MTEEEGTKVKEWIANLANGFQELQQGMKYMTDVIVKQEARIAELERDKAPKSKIIQPFAMRN